ncbi:MAG: UPF0175 family protein [Chloroflexi bacterium]|nr:UPF0175 family protein [Chloroflexota bacterium]
MSRVTLELDDDLVAAIGLLDRPPEQAARELIVLELYRRATITGGTAATLLRMPLAEFLQFAGRLGIHSIRMSEDEWEAEAAEIERSFQKGP